jgi:hypothetical protein
MRPSERKQLFDLLNGIREELAKANAISLARLDLALADKEKPPEVKRLLSADDQINDVLAKQRAKLMLAKDGQGRIHRIGEHHG